MDPVRARGRGKAHDSSPGPGGTSLNQPSTTPFFTVFPEDADPPTRPFVSDPSPRNYSSSPVRHLLPETMNRPLHGYRYPVCSLLLSKHATRHEAPKEEAVGQIVRRDGVICRDSHNNHPQLTKPLSLFREIHGSYWSKGPAQIRIRIRRWKLSSPSGTGSGFFSRGLLVTRRAGRARARSAIDSVQTLDVVSCPIPDCLGTTGSQLVAAPHSHACSTTPAACEAKHTFVIASEITTQTQDLFDSCPLRWPK